MIPGPVHTELWDHAGNLTGDEVEPPAVVTSAPERVAAAIIASIEHPRDRRVVGVTTRLLVAGTGVSPWLVERLLGWQLPRLLFRRPPASRTEGNLHAPHGLSTPRSGTDRTSERTSERTERT